MMARHYQRTKKNPYLLPHNLYMRVVYIIRDYERLKEEYNEILHSSASPNIVTSMGGDGKEIGEFGGRGKGGAADPTAVKAMRLGAISDELNAVKSALTSIPEEYRKGVMRNLLEGDRYPYGADVRTYQRWKQRMVYYVAIKLNLA